MSTPRPRFPVEMVVSPPCHRTVLLEGFVAGYTESGVKGEMSLLHKDEIVLIMRQELYEFSTTRANPISIPL